MQAGSQISDILMLSQTEFIIPTTAPIIYYNQEVNIASEWAKRWIINDLPGSTVFYQPDVSSLLTHESVMTKVRLGSLSQKV